MVRAGMALGVWVVFVSVVQAETFLVDVAGEDKVLYTDPNTGNVLRIGGFSSLVAVPGDETGTLFYVVTDRGPGGDYGDGKFFVIPDLTPSILTVAIEGGGTAQILDVLPLRKPSGVPITGIPNACVDHEWPLVDMNGDDISGLQDSDALDPEGITIDRAGNFWLCEEFRPSVCMVAPDGTVQLRLVPEGTLCGDEQVPTFDVLPGIFGKRVTNKAFEGIEMARNGKLFVMMQRPLANPDQETSDGSRNLRLLEIHIDKLLRGQRNGTFHQYLYVTEDNSKQKNVYISDIHSLTPDVFVGAERRTNQVFCFSIQDATDISKLEDIEGRLRADPSRTIEQLSPEELAALGIHTASKRVIVEDIEALDPLLGKAEGIAVVGDTLILTPDNDYNVDETTTDFSVQPAILGLQEPENLPRIVTTTIQGLPGSKK